MLGTESAPRAPSGGRYARGLVLGVVVAAGVVLGLTPVRSADVWIHLATGREIARTGQVPRTNQFSFTDPDRPVISHSWLFQLGLYELHELVGLRGLVVLQAIVGGAAIGLMYLTARVRGASMIAGAGLCGTALLEIAPRLLIRPETVALVCLALMIYLMEASRARPTRWVWAAPVLMLLWGNAHGSAVVGSVVPLGYLLARMFDRLVRPTKAPPAGSMRTLGIVAALCLIAPLLNPYGLRAIELPLTHFQTMSAGFKGFFADRRAMEWADVRGAHAAFAVLALLGVAGLVANRRDAELTDLAWFLGFGVLAATSVRFAMLFAVATAPGAAANLRIIGERFDGLLRRDWQRPAAACGAAAALVAVGLLRPGAEPIGLSVKPGLYPEAALRFLDENHVPGPLLNDFEFGGYIIWRDFPERRVFIDTRGPVAYSPDFYRQALQMIVPEREESLRAWKELISAYEISAAIVRRDSIVRHFRASDDWVPVYWDEVGSVFVRRGDANAGVIERFGYQHIKPGMEKAEIDRLAQDGAAAPRAEAELVRCVEQAPANIAARRLLAYWWDIRGANEKAITEYERLVQLQPKSAESYVALARLYADREDWGRAELACQRAIKLSQEPSAERMLLREIRLKRAAAEQDE